MEGNFDLNYEVKQVKGKGYGVFATRRIEASEVIMIGVLKEFANENDSHASQIGINTYVRFENSDIPLVNHSCSPNTGVKPNEHNGHDYVAMRSIQPGEEVCADYAMRNYSVDFFDEECCCGADNCRGRITGWKDLWIRISWI